MKVLVVGLEGAVPDLLFGNEHLINIRRLMEFGCYGNLEPVIPLDPIPSWLSFSTSLDPGALGIYGERNRTDNSYHSFDVADDNSLQGHSILDQLSLLWEHPIIARTQSPNLSLPINDVSLDCFGTSFPRINDYTNPESKQAEKDGSLADALLKSETFVEGKEEWLRDEVYAASRRYFKNVRNLLQENDWDYFQIHEIGLNLIQDVFWQYHDPKHRLFKPNNPYRDVIYNYYRYLDEEIGSVLELLDDNTSVLIISPFSTQPLDGGFFLNEWLINQGLLVLNEYPKETSLFSNLDVNWQKTRVWSQGGFIARLFFNVKGREPDGVIREADYKSFRDNVKAKIEAMTNDRGQPMMNRVIIPEETYSEVGGIAPDLIAYFDDLRWCSFSAVGLRVLHTTADHDRLYGCNYDGVGSFILAASDGSLHGPIHDASLLDMAPTLLDLGGVKIPSSMQGKSLFSSLPDTLKGESDLPEDEQALIRERLRGLGYI